MLSRHLLYFTYAYLQSSLLPLVLAQESSAAGRDPVVNETAEALAAPPPVEAAGVPLAPAPVLSGTGTVVNGQWKGLMVQGGNKMSDGSCKVDNFQWNDAPPVMTWAIDDGACGPCSGTWAGLGSSQNVLAGNPNAFCNMTAFTDKNQKSVGGETAVCSCGQHIALYDNAFNCLSITGTGRFPANIQVYGNGDCTDAFGDPYTTDGEFDVGRLAHCVNIECPGGE